MRVYERFLGCLPVRGLPPRPEGQPLGVAATGHIRRVERVLVAPAAGLAVLGFLGYYLPVYRAPELFPAVTATVPWLGRTMRLPWGELAWAVLLTTLELLCLTLLNIVGVHEIAVATGFLTPETKAERAPALLSIGLERKTTEVTRYGIDPFEGLQPWMLFLFNLVLRLKGWLANQAIRYLVRLLLGRYAVRALLDFAGVPLYMAINAYAAHAVLREAKVGLMGPDAIRGLVRRLSGEVPSPAELALVYDTLQYIAVSKRDFHPNHYLLTKELLELWQVPPDARHPCRRTTSSGSRGAAADAGSLPGAHPVRVHPRRPAVLARAPAARRPAASWRPRRPTGGRQARAAPIPPGRGAAARPASGLTLSTGRGESLGRCTRSARGRIARWASNR